MTRIVRMNGNVYDPLRRKEVPRTPEEEVRQWFIGLLHESAGVPMHQMMSEVSLEYGSGKQWRADLVIYGKGACPIGIVECKRPNVELGKEVLEQALRYNLVLGVPFLFLTNGRSTFVCRKKEQEGTDVSYELLPSFPLYEEMLIQCQR